jgi:hypothetical protein
VQHNISGLEIAMNDKFLMKSLEPVDDLFQEIGGFILSQSFHLLEVVAESAVLAELHDDEYALGGFEVVDEADDVWILSAGFHYLYLALGQFFEFWVFEDGHREGFYCHSGTVLLVIDFVDYGEASLAYFPQEVIGLQTNADEILLLLHRTFY